MAFARSVLSDYDSLFNPSEALLTNHLCAVGRQSLRGLNWVLAEGISRLSYSWQQSFFNKAVVPGYDHVIMLRKLMIKQQIDKAVSDGVRQIVILGGGYDIRGLIVALNNPDVQVYELDRGPTRESKLQGLQTLPRDIGFDDLKLTKVSPGVVYSGHHGNMKYIECDLSQEKLKDLLVFQGFNPDARALILAEGLTAYLDEEQNQQLLLAIAELDHPDNQTIISYLSAIDYTSITKAAQSSSNELLQFARSPQAVIEFAAKCGFDVEKQFCAAHALKIIGDENAEYYESHPNQIKEIYFTMKVGELAPDKKITDVAEIDLDISPITREIKSEI